MAAFMIELSAATQQVYRTKKEKYIAKFSEQFGIDPKLFRAIVDHESQGFARAERNDRARLEKQKWVWSVINQYGLDPEEPEIWHSLGYSQILFLAAMDLGLENWCKERGLEVKPVILLDIETNLYWAAKLIKKRCMNKYSKPEDIAAAYNAGSMRWDDADGDGIKDPDERYENQKYVSSIMAIYNKLP